MTRQEIKKQGLVWYFIVTFALFAFNKAYASEWYVNGKLVDGKGEAIVAAARDPKAVIEKKDRMQFDNKKGTFKILKETK